MSDESVICPRCGEKCKRDSVHNGLAMLYGPWGCTCGWSEYEEYDQSRVKQPESGFIDQWGGFTPRRRNENADPVAGGEG